MHGWSELFARGRGRVLLFCWLGWTFDLCDLLLFSFTKPQIAKDVGLELYGPGSGIAWIEGLGLFATAVGGFCCGRLADRIGRRPAMVASILAFAAGTASTAAAGGFWSLLGARLLTGLGAGGEWGIGHALVAEHWPQQQRDFAHGLLQAGSPVGMALAAVLGCFVAPALGWRAVFLLAASPALLAAAARWALPIGERAPRPAAMPARLLFAPALRRPSIVLLAVLTLHMAGFWAVYAQLPAALIKLHDVAPHDVGWFQLQVNGVQVFADVAFGFLAARYGRRRMFALFCALFALGQLLALLRLDAVAGDFRAFTWTVACIGLGQGTWSCFGALFGAHYPAPLRATAASTFYSLARGAQFAVVPLLATALSAGSFAPALWLGAGCALGSAALIALLPAPRQPPAGSVTEP
jgi:MFS family permease